MSRSPKFRLFWSVAAITTVLSSGAGMNAFAVDEATRAEIVYRANLGRADDIKLLVSQGASPDQADAKGVPIIALASVRTDSEGINILSALVDSGANINATDPSGQNALFYAARSGNVQAVQFLLAHRIDIQAINNRGDTARVVASNTGHPDIVQMMDNYVIEQNKRAAQAAHDAELARQEAEKKTQLAEPSMAAPPAFSPPPPVNGAHGKSKGNNTNIDELVPITNKKSKLAAEARIQAAYNNIEDPSANAADASIQQALGNPAGQANPVEEKKLEIAAPPPPAKAITAVLPATSPSVKLSEPVPITAPAIPAITAGTLNVAPPTAPPVASVAPSLPVAAPETRAAVPPAPPPAISPPTSVAAPATAVKTPEQFAEEAELQRAKEEVEETRKQDIKRMAYDVAYHTCAFQYWAYCLEIKQSSELSREEMEIAIQTQKEAVEGLEKKLVVDYALAPKFYENVTHSAQLRIYDQLDSMRSNRVRHENGVGKMDDMQNRCEEIGRQWGFPADIKPRKPPEDTKGSGSNKSSDKAIKASKRLRDAITRNKGANGRRSGDTSGDNSNNDTQDDSGQNYNMISTDRIPTSSGTGGMR